MLGGVWLLGPHKIYPFSLPTAMAQEAVSAWLSLAQLVSAGRDHPVFPVRTLSPGSGTTKTACCSWGQEDTCAE